MKKISECILLLLFLSRFFAACDENTEDPSTVTSFATFEEVKGAEQFPFSGELFTFVELGSAYVDPGVRVTENGTDVSDKVTVAGTVDPRQTGIYRVTYRVNNRDGFPASVVRNVIVSDSEHAPETDLSGEYVSNYSEVGTQIYKMHPGVFFLNDFMGFGFVNINAGNMAAAFGGYFLLLPDNTIRSLYSYASGFGATGEMADGRYDPEEGSISYTFRAAAIGVEYPVNLKIK